MNKNVRKDIIICIIVIVFAILLPQVLDEYWLSIFILMGINVLMVTTLRTITLMGHFSMGHLGFSLVGAYCSALLVMKLGVSFWVAMMAAGFMAGILAFILGFPFLRVRGIYFVVLTILTSETLRLLAYYWTDLTGGFNGLPKVPPPDPITLPVIGVIQFDSTDNYYLLMLVIVGVSHLLLYLLENSHLGFKWRIIRDSEDLSKSVGVNVMWYKVANFAIASFFAGIAGSLSAHFVHCVSPEATTRFGTGVMFSLLLYMVIGGMESFWGPAVGTIILTMITEILNPFAEIKSLITGLMAIIVFFVLPEGIVSIPGKCKRLLYKLFKKQTGNISASNQKE